MKSLLHFLCVLFFSGAALSDAKDVFVPVDETWLSTGSRVEVPNMPRIRDQGSAPFCTGFAVQQIFQHYHCLQEKIADCKNPGLADEVSPLAVMARCYRDQSEGEFFRDKEKDSINMDLFYNGPKNHRNIRMNMENDRFCDTRSLAFKLGRFPAVNTEECYPYDQLANRFPPLEKSQEFNNNKKKIESYFDEYKTDGSICMQCFERDVKSFLYPTTGMKAPSSEVMLQALKQDSYNKMWYYLFNQDNCKSRIAPFPREIHLYPVDIHNRTEWVNSYDKAINIVKEAVVNNKKPIAMDLCVVRATKIEYGRNQNCDAGHSVTIAGYDVVYKNENGKKQFREVVKIYNSWGERSYSKNSDGSLNMWFDAKSLFKNIGPGAEGYVSMVWIE